MHIVVLVMLSLRIIDPEVQMCKCLSNFTKLDSLLICVSKDCTDFTQFVSSV